MKPVMIQPGTLLQNRYRVAEQIGKGGMGEVYVATDERFQSKVAIKRTFFGDAEMLKAFGREARLLNRLRHPALPKVSDHFSEDEGQFLVMEFIEGSDLAELLKRRKVPFSLADVMRWADELLDALEYLHSQEPAVVHRDIKPQNIKLTPRGNVVLLDFGLAKGMPSQSASGTASSIFGYSLSFAPLEQIQGSGTDPRSDLYSLAATLYFLLTAVRPTDALTRAAATVKQQADPLRPAHMVQPQVPAAVGQILHRAMSQNSALRHATAAELRAALRAATNDGARREESPAVEVSVPLLTAPPSQAAAKVNSPAQAEIEARPPARASQRSATPSISFHASSLSVDEADEMSEGRRRPLLSDSRTVSAPGASTQERTRNSLGLVASVLIVCVGLGVYLFARTSGSRTQAERRDNAAVDNSAPAYPSNTQTEQAAPSTSPASSQPSQAANERLQVSSSNAAAATPASSHQANVGEPNAAAPNSQSVSATTDDSNGSLVSAPPSGRPGLVIQNPAPAATPVEETRREAVPVQQQRPEYRPEYENRPPPPYYPPPPDGRRPPPPPPPRRPFP